MAISEKDLEVIKAGSGAWVGDKFIKTADLGSPSSFGGSPASAAATTTALASGVPLYKKADGVYTTDKRYAISPKISIDEAGTVKVNAPEEFFQSDYWLGDESAGYAGYKSQLETISSAYKQGGNAIFMDAEGNEKSLTENIEELNSSIAKDVKSYNALYDYKTSQAKNFGTGDWTDRQARIAAQNAKYGYDAYYLPAWFVNGYMKDLKGLDSLKEAGDNYYAISSDDWKKFWAQGGASKYGFSMDDVADMQADVEEQISSLLKAAAFGVGPETQSESYINNVASTIALYETMKAGKPDTDFWTGTAGAVRGAATSFFKDVANLTNIGPELVAISGAFGSTLAEAMKGEEDFNWDKTFEKWHEQVRAEGIVAPAIGDAVAEAKEEIDRLSNTMDSFAAGAFVGHLAYKALENIVVLNPLGQAVGSGISGVINGALASAAVETGAEAVSVASDLASDLAIGSALIIPNLNAGNVATYIGSVILPVAAEEAARSTVIGSLVGFTANVTTQAVLETTLDDYQAIGNLVQSGDTEVMNIFASNMLWNAVGEVSGYGASKGLEAFAETRAGQAIARGKIRTANALASKINGVKEKVQSLFKKWEGAEPVAQYNRAFRELVGTSQEQVATASREGLELAVTNRVALENYFDAYTHNILGTVNYIKALPDMADAITGWSATMLKAQTIEGSLGIRKAVGSTLSEQSADYMGFKLAADQLAYKETAVGLNEAETAKYTAIKDYLDNLTKDISPKLRTALDENLEALEKVATRLNTWAISEDVAIIPREQVLSLRAQPLFGEDGSLYTFTQRFKGKATSAYEDMMATIRKNAGTSLYEKEELSEIMSRPDKVDLDDHFIDPNVVLESKIHEYARSYNQKKWGESMLAIKGHYKVLGSASSLGAARNFSTSWATYNREVQQGIVTAIKDGEFSVGDISMVILRSDALSVSPEDIAALSRQFSVPDYANMTWDSTTAAKNWYNELPMTQQGLVDSALGGKALTPANLKQAFIDNPNTVTAMQRAYMMADDEILSSKSFQDAVDRARQAKDAVMLLSDSKATPSQMLENAERIKKLAKLEESGEDLAKELADTAHDAAISIIDKATYQAYKSSSTGLIAENLTKRGVSPDLAARYGALTSLTSKKVGKTAIAKEVRNYITSESQLDIFGSLSGTQQNRLIKEVTDAVYKEIEGEVDVMTRELIDAGLEDLVDMDAYFMKIESLAESLAGSTDVKPTTIKIADKDGVPQIVEVDPLVAYLYKNRPVVGDAGSLSRSINIINRTFRLFTTGFSPKSLANQWIKDPGNAYFLAGAKMFEDVGMGRLLGDGPVATVKDSLVNKVGEQVVAQLKGELSDESWKLLEQTAKQTGKSIERVAVEYDVVGRAYRELGESGTETRFYQRLSEAYNEQRDLKRAAKGLGVSRTQKDLISWADDASRGLAEKLERAMPNEVREVYLRQASYASAFSRAIEHGKTVPEARLIASRTMQDATTNFARSFTMANSFIRNVPYLGAALNGASSFWRLMQIDPMGITSRIWGGAILPGMALIAESLGDETNREVYSRLKEYEKDGSLVFVTNGMAVTIPLPEQIAGFFNPFRQAVESMAGVTDGTFGEFFLNDILALPALDLSGFYEFNNGNLGADPSIGDRIGHGMEKLIFSQLSNPAVSTAYMIISGRDPYTGASLMDTYSYVLEDGTVGIMNGYQSNFANALAAFCQSNGYNLSAYGAHKIFSNFFGSGLESLINGVTSTLSGDFTGAISSALEDTLGSKIHLASGMKTKANQEWATWVSKMYDERDALMNSQDGMYSTLLRQINTETNATKREAAITQYKGYIQEFQQKVIDGANQMRDTYGMTAAQQASVLSLLTMYDQPYAALNSAQAADSKNLYYTARDQAVAAAQRLGFSGANEGSIFGYATYDSNGQLTYKFNNPVTVLYLADNLTISTYTGENYSQAAIALADIQAAISASNLKTVRDKMYNEVAKARAAKNYNEVDRLYEEYDNKVMQVIWPYISSYDFGNLLSYEKVIEYLDDWIKVPSSAMGKGKYYSSSTGLDKQAGYIKSYLNKIYEKMKGGK